MKQLIFTLLLVVSQFCAMAQKVDYKKNTILVDQTEIATVAVEKTNMGLTKNFTLLSNQGQKLVTAVVSTEFEADKSDNTSLYYRFHFLPTNQTGIFKLSVLSLEKEFAQLIGKSGIVEGETLNAEKVNLFIAQRGVTPKIALDYTVVARKTNWPIQLQEDHQIEQDQKIIGRFQNKGKYKEADVYEYFIPSSILIAKVQFVGGNNAQNFEVFTPKDKQTRMVSIPQKEVIKFSANTVDPNFHTLKRVTAWLVENGYL